MNLAKLIYFILMLISFWLIVIAIKEIIIEVYNNNNKNK